MSYGQRVKLRVYGTHCTHKHCQNVEKITLTNGNGGIENHDRLSRTTAKVRDRKIRFSQSLQMPSESFRTLPGDLTLFLLLMLDIIVGAVDVGSVSGLRYDRHSGISQKRQKKNLLSLHILLILNH